jgi:hypothetical protein
VPPAHQALPTSPLLLQIYTSRYVVVTVPLGVLKKGSISFNPPLSTAKQTAISAVGYGVLDKVSMVFPTPAFWTTEIDTFQFNRIPPAGQERQWMEYYQLATHASQPVIAAFNAGSAALAVEQLSNDTMLAQVGAAGLCGMCGGMYVWWHVCVVACMCHLIHDKVLAQVGGPVMWRTAHAHLVMWRTAHAHLARLRS